VAMQKVDGIAVTLAKLRQIIKSNGFASKEASVLARGSASGERAFVVSGTHEQVSLSTAPRPVGKSWQLAVPPVKRQ